MESMYIWPDMPALSIAVIAIASMVFLYLAREPMHNALNSLTEGTAGGLKKIADWANDLAQKMQDKNQKVLLESGIAEAEQKIYEEFKRMEVGYTKHLADYPKLHLKIDDNITKIDVDYKECGQVTPEAPGWSEVVESITKVQGSSGDRVIEKMLSEIHKSAIDGEKKTLAELRNISSKRHKILGGMAPIWKKITTLMKDVNSKVERVLENTSRIDKYMEQYEKLNNGGSDSIDMLTSKATKLFIFALIVIVVAGFGAFINFQLIALPMSELVPAGSRLMGIPVSSISALVIVALEVVLGIFLMEALGITNIFPQIATMTRGKRLILLYASLFGLFFLASVEASLAVLREALAEAKSATDQALAGTSAVAEAENASSEITVIGQATLGFVLPWILAMVAVPLEMFIESCQNVIMRFVILFVRLFGYINKMLGYLIEYTIKIFIHLYDAFIIVPTKIGDTLQSKSSK